MSDVFISYSRKDLAFVVRLRKLLEDADLSVWVDIEGLYAGEEFWPEVAKAVDAALALIFVITPDSIASKFCAQELERAVGGQKRIVPVLHREVDAGDLHPALANRQWVFFRDLDDADAAREALLSAVRADWVRLRQQARLLVRAREWQTKHRDASLLLRGRDLREAEDWLAQSRGQENGPTPLHSEYIQASRHAAKQRLLRLGGGAAAALAAIVIVTWFALAQRVASLSNLSLDDLTRGQPAAAIDKLERATALCGRFAFMFKGCDDAALNLGRAYLDAGKHSEALAQFSTIIDAAQGAATDNPVAVEFRATAYQNRAFAHIMVAESQAQVSQRLDQYARAQQDLDTAAALYARTPAGAGGRPLAITRARIHIGRGEYDEALTELDRASRVSDAPDIDLLLSVVHHCQGNGVKSLQYFRRYIDSLPGRLQDPQWKVNKDYYARIRQRCTGPG